MRPAAVAIDLDGAIGDTRSIWNAFLDDAARRFRSIAELDADALPADRAEAADELDRWAAAGVGDWRGALERFAEDHAPLHLRPSARAGACLRTLGAAGVRIGLFTDAPAELAQIAAAHLGVARRVEVVESGAGALDRLLERFGSGTAVVRTFADLEALTA